VYRVSEGAENLGQNYHTFNDCIEVFKKNGIVLIFSEGGCINEWHLRTLKKGTARLALAAWEKEIPLQILPVGINYNSFSSFGKNIQLHFGSLIAKHDVIKNEAATYGTNINKINAAIKLQLEKLVVQIKPVDKAIIKKVFEIKIPFTQKILLAITAVVGYILHWPLYQPLQKISYKKFSKIDHYDSVLVGLLFLLYPIYLLVCTLLICLLLKSYWGLFTFVIMPFTAWSYVALKKQF
jgi:1-acyl-sn-glycerol-3-phosphate acyltransferase